MSNEMSKKIHELRKQHKLTLEQVASVVGVGKSTVRKWETGMIANMKRDKIALLAQALHTTPEYLMGWEKEPSPISEPPLTEEEKKWMEIYHRLSNETREMLITSLDELDPIDLEQQQLVLDLIRVALKNRK